MTPTQLQAVAIMLALFALAFSPLVFSIARRRDAEAQPASPPPGDPTTVEGVLSPRQALAHLMYGDAVGWEPVAMADYDNSLALQAMWETEARYKMEDRLRYRISPR